jgi:2-dehydropantoate 2-reductase
MYQDITSGRKTEIDFLNGAIVSRAKKLGIDAPYNTFISEQIRFMEALQAEKLKQD